ncbi:MAG TPA: signal recognition particle-docking protein FtsY [Polyangia bacterium]|nr:signal recognition particle-docking protein FtsY [Polyangia bacterium]
MSTPVILGIIAAVVAIIVIIVVVRRKKEPEILPSPVKEPSAKEPAAREAEAKEAKRGGPESVSEAVPSAPPTPEVRIADKEEEAAAEQLRSAKRERKLQKLRQGLAPTRGGFIAKLGALFQEKKIIDPALLDEIEEALITADVGAKTTEWLIGLLRAALDKDELADPDAVWKLLEQEIGVALAVAGKPWDPKAAKPYCIMVVGVNGVGKTTTIGKLASQFGEQGLKVVLAAADTFRAAAVNQLEIWGRRAGCEVVKPAKEGADPSSVVFDAIKKAGEIGADVVIADTAGRLHTQAPLMEELKKVHRVMGKALDGAPHQVLLVLDATTGQNALQQVAEFGSALGIDGIVITKLDGTAKGGVLIGVCHEHEIPVRFIGIGEAKDDLRDFEVTDFVEALFFRGEPGNNIY